MYQHSNHLPRWLQPQVTKKQVDNFREGKLTPCCQLKAQVVGRRKKIPYLSHQVMLEGAKYPHNVFIIDLPAEGTKYQVMHASHVIASFPGSSQFFNVTRRKTGPGEPGI